MKGLVSTIDIRGQVMILIRIEDRFLLERLKYG